MTTGFTKKCEILSDILLNYQSEKFFEDFIDYNNQGLPWANFVMEGKSVTEEMGWAIENTFDDLLKLFDLEDEGFENLSQILQRALQI